MNSQTLSGVTNPSPKTRAWLLNLSTLFDKLSPFGDLLLRCWVAYAFWVSGLTKIQTWDSTLYLFENEYNVPLLPPELAAYLAERRLRVHLSLSDEADYAVAYVILEQA